MSLSLEPHPKPHTQVPSSNWTRDPLPENDFRSSVAAMCSSSATAAAGDLRFLPLLFVVLAIAARLAPERLCGDVRSRRLTSQRYYWSCEYLHLPLRSPPFISSTSTPVTSHSCRHPAELFGDDLDPTVGKSKNFQEITYLHFPPTTERSVSHV